MEQLARVLAQRCDPDAMSELRTRADNGDIYAATSLAWLLADRGDCDALAELRRELNAWNSEATARALLGAYSDCTVSTSTRR